MKAHACNFVFDPFCNGKSAQLLQAGCRVVMTAGFWTFWRGRITEVGAPIRRHLQYSNCEMIYDVTMVLVASSAINQRTELMRFSLKYAVWQLSLIHI